jgi:asparagine synthase (glutamine-hydrolysing)
MCGICGIVRRTSSASTFDLRAAVTAMADRLAHRGPDDAGVEVRRYAASEIEVGLGHRRLSIIDLSPAGHQPMQLDSRRDVWITYNGEVYNFPELRRELEGMGIRFRSGTDTEVILASYEKWGTACVERLGGMFAFAIWDGERRELFLARDRLGKKPLAYWHTGDVFAFASELTALTTLEALPRAFDDQSLAAYFTLGFVPGDRSIFASVRKLPPAHRAVWRDGRLTLERYWNPIEAARAAPAAARRREELLDDLDDRLRRSTQQRLISDVPLGAWLSGGVDSTLVVAEMCRAQAGRVRTFTIGFEDAERDESAMARAVANYLGTQHEEFRVTSAEMLAAVPEAAAVYDEPFADEAGIPTYLVSRMSRRHVTVALCGDGGDEGFMGYHHYRRGRLLAALNHIPARLRQGVARVGGMLGGQMWRQRMRSLGFADWADVYVAITSMLRPETAGRVAAPFALDGTIYRDIARRLNGCEPETVLAIFDTMTTLPDKFLVKVDRASMRVALEVRAPFLDHTLVEWALKLPRAVKLRGGITKYLLRELLYRKVPRELVDRPKMGFCPPVGRWLRTDLLGWARDVLAPARVREAGVLDAPAVARMVDLHLSGRADFGRAMWTLICFLLWRDRAVGGLHLPRANPGAALSDSRSRM